MVQRIFFQNEYKMFTKDTLKLSSLYDEHNEHIVSDTAITVRQNSFHILIFIVILLQVMYFKSNKIQIINSKYPKYKKAHLHKQQCNKSKLRGKF